MEPKTTDEEKERIHKLLKPVFEKELGSPKEQPSTQAFLGIRHKKPKRRAWFPQNFREYYDFDKTTFKPPNQRTTNPPKLAKGWVEVTGFLYKTSNYGKEHMFMNWHWCNILVKKHQVCVTFKRIGNQWFDIKYYNPAEYEQFVRDKVEGFHEDCKKALALFIAYYGGKSNFKLLRRYKFDNGFSQDKDIDRLPAEYRINTDLFKKDYKEKWEFKGIEPMINRVYNTSLEDELPDLHGKIDVVLELAQASIKMNASSSDVLKGLVEANKQHMDFQNQSHKDQMEIQAKWKQNFEKHYGVLDGTKKEVKRLGDVLSVFAEHMTQKEKKHRIDLVKTAYRQAFGRDYW